MDVFKPMNFTKSDAMVQTNFDLLNNDMKIEILNKLKTKLKISNNKDFVKMIVLDNSYKDLIQELKSLGIQI